MMLRVSSSRSSAIPAGRPRRRQSRSVPARGRGRAIPVPRRACHRLWQRARGGRRACAWRIARSAASARPRSRANSASLARVAPSSARCRSRSSVSAADSCAPRRPAQSRRGATTSHHLHERRSAGPPREQRRLGRARPGPHLPHGLRRRLAVKLHALRPARDETCPVSQYGSRRRSRTRSWIRSRARPGRGRASAIRGFRPAASTLEALGGGRQTLTRASLAEARSSVFFSRTWCHLSRGLSASLTRALPCSSPLHTPAPPVGCGFRV